MRRFLPLALLIVLAACNLSSDDAAPTAAGTETLIAPQTFVAPTATETPPPTDTLIPTNTPIADASATTEPTLPIGVRVATAQSVGTPIEYAQTTQAPDTPRFPLDFPDRYTVDALAGQIIIVNYAVTLDNPGVGRVFIVVRDPNGDDIQQLFINSSTEDSAEVPANRSGTYEVLVAFENLRGNYSVTFGLRQP